MLHAVSWWEQHQMAIDVGFILSGLKFYWLCAFEDSNDLFVIKKINESIQAKHLEKSVW